MYIDYKDLCNTTDSNDPYKKNFTTVSDQNTEEKSEKSEEKLNLREEFFFFEPFKFGN